MYIDIDLWAIYIEVELGRHLNIAN